MPGAGPASLGDVSRGPGVPRVFTPKAFGWGLGVDWHWLAHPVRLIRAVRDPDAFPAADLGLRRALERLGGGAGRPDRWRPWRAYAAVHLWNWSAGGPAANGGSPPVARPASAPRLAANK